MVSHIHEVWPQTKLVFRLGTYTNTLDGKNANVEQLNQHSTAVLQRLGIPLLPWSYLVRGEPETSYADPIHFHGICKPDPVNFRANLADAVLSLMRPMPDTSSTELGVRTTYDALSARG